MISYLSLCRQLSGQLGRQYQDLSIAAFVYLTTVFIFAVYRSTIMDKIYETNSSFHVKWLHTGKL